LNTLLRLLATSKGDLLLPHGPQRHPAVMGASVWIQTFVQPCGARVLKLEIDRDNRQVYDSSDDFNPKFPPLVPRRYATFG
jgi:hypothetical protein